MCDSAIKQSDFISFDKFPLELINIILKPEQDGTKIALTNERR